MISGLFDPCHSKKFFQICKRRSLKPRLSGRLYWLIIVSLAWWRYKQHTWFTVSAMYPTYISALELNPLICWIVVMLGAGVTNLTPLAVLDPQLRVLLWAPLWTWGLWIIYTSLFPECIACMQFGCFYCLLILEKQTKKRFRNYGCTV